MDILRIFRMQEPVSKKTLTKHTELGQYKEVVMEKDVLLKNHLARIKDLENEIAELKLKNVEMENKIRVNNMGENEFHSVMMNYDDFFKKIWLERKELFTEKQVAEKHISNLEKAYEELLEKYSKATMIIESLIENQNTLKTDLEEYQQIVMKLEQKYDTLKNYSEFKIAEANQEIDNKEKGNIQEVAKLKAKILHSQAKINELEKHVKVEDIRQRQSIFAPLKNSIART